MKAPSTVGLSLTKNNPSESSSADINTENEIMRKQIFFQANL
jgi:hypothetical protein